jgi:hypothetical protein
MPPGLSGLIGTHNYYERQKQQALWEAQNNLHVRTWGPNSSISPLDLAAIAAHPGWKEAEKETIGFNGRLFQKVDEENWHEIDSSGVIAVKDRVFFQVDKRAHRTIQSIRKWFEKNHVEEANRIKSENDL